MRHLSVKQKRLLKEEWERLHNEEGIEYPKRDDIPWKTYNEIYEVHPCEIHHNNVDHFFHDLNNEALEKWQEEYPFRNWR